MSKISLAPNASGTGTLTIAAPNTNTDRTLTLPDAAGTVFVSGQSLSATTGSFSGDVTLGSSVLATPSGSAPSYTCRAWCNFNGAGTVAIRASGNVSSITDNGAGNYRINFATAMPDANYSVVTGVSESGIGGTSRAVAGDGYLASSALVLTYNPSVLIDYQFIQVAIFR